MFLKQSYQGKNDWWRYLITFGIVLIAKSISEIPISVLAVKKATENNDLLNIRNYINADALDISNNHYFLLMFAPMVFVFGVLVLSMSLIHGYSFTQVFTAYKKFRWKNFFIAALLWMVLLAAVEFIHYFSNPEGYSINFKGTEFFVLVLISLVFVPFQACSEELYFRGNLLQGFGMLFKSRFAAIILTGALFGFMHFGNPEVAKFGVVPSMIQYVGFGILLGIVVVMDGGMEMAFGMHTINNIYLVSLVSYSGSVIKTSSLILTSDINVIIMTVGFLCAAVIYLFALSKIFKWKPFSWMFSPLEKQ